MQDHEIAQLKATYQNLMVRCKGGSGRTTPVPDEKLKAAADGRSFCAICVANWPPADFYLKLFEFQVGFWEKAPVPPSVPVSEESVAAYLRECLDLLRNWALQISASEIAEKARRAVLDKGAHFSGKLIHSDVQGAFMLVAAKATHQPHLSSRSLAARGIDIPLDQCRLDNAGVYQRIVKIWSNDPILTECDFPQSIADAIRAGTREAIKAGQEKVPAIVDHRLRQILLPSGDGYLAISPLAAGGMSALVDFAVRAIEADASFPADETESDGSQTPDILQLAQKPGRKKEKSEEDATEERRPKPIRLNRLGFPVGGAIVRNTSLHSASVVQRPVFFMAPQRQVDMRRAWGFLARSVRLHLSASDLRDYAYYLSKTHGSVRKSAAGTAVDIECCGPLRRLVLDRHRKFMDLSALVAESHWLDGDQQIPINENLLRLRRSSSPTDLDICIVNQSFGTAYAQGFAKEVAALLASQVLDSKTGNPMLSIEDRLRVERAAQRILGVRL